MFWSPAQVVPISDIHSIIRGLTFQILAGEREHEARHAREGQRGPRRGHSGGGDQAVPGTNCIKIGLPGKSIL